MASKLPPTAGPALPKAFIAELLGVTDAAQADLVEQVVEALSKISDELVPRLHAHPFADAIALGVAAYPDLLARFRRSKDEAERAAILDAVAEIVSREHATVEVLEALQKVIGGTKSPAVASTAARAIALARDEGFLEQQRNFLASEELQDVRIAAKLLGYGRYSRAVPALLLLLRPDNMAVASPVIWALGEIASPDALPKLHGMLSDLIMTEEVVEAIGKIGDPTSVIRLLPLLIEGTQPQREKTARALSRIARKSGGFLGDEGLRAGAMTALERTIDKDTSLLARFHAIVAYSLLGGHLEPSRIKKALGAKISGKDLDAVSGFLSRPTRETPAKSPRRSPKKPRKPI